MSVRRSCRLARLQPSVWYQKSEVLDQSALRLRIREIAMGCPRFGYLRVQVMLRREGWPVGKKRVYRLYRLEGLQLRMMVKRLPSASVCNAVASYRPRGRTRTGVWISFTTKCRAAGRFASSR